MKQWLCRNYAIPARLAAGIAAAALLRQYPSMSIFLAAYLAAAAVMLPEEIYLKKKAAGEAAPKEKKCMAVLAAAMLACLLLPEQSFLFADLLACAGMAALLIDAVLRTARCVKAGRIQGRKRGQQKDPKKRRLRKRMIVAVILCYVLGGAILPFAYQPPVSENTEESFAVEDFYGSGYTGERAKVIPQNGEALKERIRLIEQAEEEIILSTLEFDADISGKQVLAALMKAAERGVKISVLADGFSYMPQMWWNPYFLALAQTEQARIRVYNTPDPLRPWTAMGRLHDKYLIVDDLAYILGGRNTYDFFLGDQPGYKNYDWDVLIFKEDGGSEGAGPEGGASVMQVRNYFEEVWNSGDCREFGEGLIWGASPAVRSARGELERLYETMRQEHSDWFEEPDYAAETLPVQNIRLVSNPTHIFSKEPVVYYAITGLMKQAKEEVVFHTPYIVCNDWMLERLEEVCGGTAEVWMMTNSVANNGNPFGALDYQKYKGKILETGVKIMEYDGGISYHGKCFVVDDRLSAIGSFNWDMRSAYLDTELMLVIDSEPVNRALREAMGQYEKDALRVLDETDYELPEGREMQEISTQRKLRILVLGTLLGWARFLM